MRTSQALATGIIAIDLQSEFVGEGALFPVPGSERIVNEANIFIRKAREHGATVIFTAFAVPDSQPLGLSTTRLGVTSAHRYPHAALVVNLDRAESDIVVEKSRQSAFVGTALELILRRKGIEHLVILGFTTHACCLATVFDAGALDFRVTVLSDLTASPYVPAKDRLPAMTADEAHLAALQFIGLHGRVALSDDVLRELAKNVEEE